MDYRSLGKCGTNVSVLSLGGWTTFGESVQDRQLTQSIIRYAYDAGINFFDIADIYAIGESERMMGEVLREFPRHTLVISSKVFWPMSDDINDRGLSRKHIMESIDKSLQRIGTDYLDIYFCHRYDENTPVEETCRAMDDLIHQGKILYWGTSEWTGDQLREALDICERYNLYKPQVEQPHYNLLVWEKMHTDVIPTAEDNGLGLVIWSPLASGVLTGKYDNGIPDDTRLARMDWLRNRFEGDASSPFERVKVLKSITDELGITRAQLAMAWTIRRTSISSAITGATKLEQLQENLKVLALQIDEAVWAQVDSLMGIQ
ncbi:MAG: aldo/keto reductase family protein [Anaerolineales bacterium]|nr:aldo/keto reductase family protein [Anaerolineales bacterium]